MKRKFVFAFVSALAMMSSAQESVTLTIGDVALTAGSSTRAVLKITSDKAVTDYCSYQFDLMLPEGVEMPYVESESGYGYYLYDSDLEEDVFKPAYTSTMTTASHSFDVAAITGGYRFICKSGTLTPFKADKTGVLTVQLIASSTAVNGTYPITLGGVQKFSIADESGSHSIIPTVVSGKCTITGGTSTTTLPFTMTDAGWGTIILPFDHEIPSGLTAYTCDSYTEVSGVNWLTLTKVSALTANTPYILAGTAGNYEFTGTPSFTSTTYTEGLLTGVLVATSIDHGYVLQKQSDEVAFFKVESGKSKTVPAYRCYLNDNPSGAIAFRMDDATGIEQRMLENEDGPMYDLQGRPCPVNPESGIYIRNGKLIMVK